jgi:hypothetical protein
MLPTLADAGHLPPYLNGQPLDMEAASPLGMLGCKRVIQT